MTLIEFILSLNILDIITDFTFFIQYNYPNLWIKIDNMFMYIYELIFNIFTFF